MSHQHPISTLEELFQSADWYQALTLTERLRTLRERRLALPRTCQHEALNVIFDAQRAKRRLERWQSQSPFKKDKKDDYFAQRLAMDGMTEEEFLDLLGEPPSVVRDRLSATPLWLTNLAQAFTSPISSEAISRLCAKGLDGQKMAGFLNAIKPLLHQARHRVQEGVLALIEGQSALPFDPETIVELLFGNLPGRLLMMLGRTMVLELNVARLQGFLDGETAQERFASFLERLRQPEVALAILQEYPVLARQLMIAIEQWIGFSLEFVQHLCADWQAIQATFCAEESPGGLVAVNGGAGDTHRGGRSVMIAHFESGFQLVYKPKSLAVDVHFQELLRWLNERRDYPPFRTLKMVAREGYGWVEFVAAQGCTSREEIGRFYERQGGYLALLYALSATDFHFENLIASGEHPILVDLEALFHPRVGEQKGKRADEMAGNTLYDSVLRVGLLPQRMWGNEESDGIELSGLGAAAGQMTPYRVPQWDGVGTDEMYLTRKQVEMSGGHNRPTLDGADVNVLDYVEQIMAGFSQVYRLLLRHRDELLSEEGPLARFAEDEVRVILRPTRTYGLLLHESTHPDVLRNALDRDRLFDRLWLSVEHQPYLAQVIGAEQQALQNGDIPMFTTRPLSRDLWSDSGERMADFFSESGMTLVERRVQQLSEADLEQQLWFIRASLTTLAMGEDHAPQARYHLTSLKMTGATPERLLAAAQAVGDRLEALALRGEEDAAWIGLTLTAKNHWTLVPLGVDLYNGLPGVALFLAYLGQMTAQPRYTALAEATLTTIRRQVEENQSYLSSIGGFDGWGGVIYTLTHLATLWDRPDLLLEAEKLVNLLPDLIAQDEAFDIISGAAGCLGALLALYRCQASDEGNRKGLPLRVAIQCGERLIDGAQKMEAGIGWMPQVAGSEPLTGFSHGAAGIAWALLELAELSGQERFRTAARAAIEYERRLFLPEEGNWPDLRELEVAEQGNKEAHHLCMTAWCHGAPGIGLARLHSLRHLDDPESRAESRAEIDSAIKTTLAQGFGSNHSLCHGDLGNLELLLQASHILDDQNLRQQVNRLSFIILASIEQYGWQCGIPLGVESPGLMTGLAGIGYGLLRLAFPAHIPSLLTLDPPPLET